MVTTTEHDPLSESGDGAAAASGRFPLPALLALAMAGFITILTEALPAGLLPQIGNGLSVSEALAGQLVTIYAIGSLVAAIPLTAATQGMRRKPLLLSAIIGFVIANTVTALSGHYVLTMAAIRVVARLKAKACASVKDIDPAPVSSGGPSPADRRPTCPAVGRNHREGEAVSDGTLRVVRPFTG